MDEPEYVYAKRQAVALERIADATEHLAKLLDHVHKNPVPFRSKADEIKYNPGTPA